MPVIQCDAVFNAVELILTPSRAHGKPLVFSTLPIILNVVLAPSFTQISDMYLPIISCNCFKVALRLRHVLAPVFPGIGAISRLKANKNTRHSLDLWRVHYSKCKRFSICSEIAAFSSEILLWAFLCILFSYPVLRTICHLW